MKVGNCFKFNLVLFSLIVLTVAYVKCKQTTIQQPDITQVIENFGSVAVDNVQARLPPCALDIQNDLPKGEQPIYLVPNKQEFWLPNDQGYIEVPFGETIELYCPSGFINSTECSTQVIPKNIKTIKLSCYLDNTFLWNGGKFEFNYFTCLHPPRFLVDNTGIKCSEDEAFVYRVGFNVTHDRFIKTMEICHDAKKLQTHYTLHSLIPANFHFQRFVKRINFSKAGHFQNVNINFLYSQRNQINVAKTLWKGNYIKYFDNTTLYLARGHLAAKSDQIYANQQRSTFTFFNVAPQWQSFNSGLWAQLENEVRKFVHQSNLKIYCYTGTWGTLQLSQQSAEKRQFYLSYEKNNTGILPVPQLFYRLIINDGQPTHGIVLIGVNNPHASMQEIFEEYIVCQDIKDDIPWLKWIKNNNLKKGYLYACSVGDFIRVVNHLPKKLDVVKEILK